MKICENVHQIKIEFQVTEDIRRYVYVYLITGKYCYLIDSGVAGSERIIAQYMKRLGRSIEEIKAVFLTHSHPDHIGGAAEIQEMSGCKVYCSGLEREWAENIEKQFQERPIPNFYTLVQKSVGIDEIVTDGDIISLEPGITIRVAETPGHSQGSVSYVLEERGVLFSGDAIPDLKGVPVFTDEEASERSLETIYTMRHIAFCCPAWDRVYRGDEIQGQVESSLLFLRKLKRCVRETEQEYENQTDRQKQRILCDKMGWADMDENPLFHRSIQACKG